MCRTIQINSKQHYLWQAVDQDGEVVDFYLQARRDGAAAKRLFTRLIRSHGAELRKIVTDKLRSYPVAHREVMPEAIHTTDQSLVTAHAAVSNLFNLGRHLIRAEHYRNLRVGAFNEWSRAVA